MIIDKKYRLTIDTKEDLYFIRRIFKYIKSTGIKIDKLRKILNLHFSFFRDNSSIKQFHLKLKIFNEKKQIKISVIIPIFNQEKYIGRCLRSILSQSFDESFYEVIVVDDGSNDYSIKILEAFSDKIKIVKHKENLGLPSALNSGIKKARGKYIV